MRKLTITLLCLIALFCTVFSVTAFAEEPTGNVTIIYSEGDTAFSNLEIKAYYIADYDGQGKFTLVHPFTTYPIGLSNIKSQQEWRDLATTLIGCIGANQPTPEFVTLTDANGAAILENARQGLYFVPAMSVKEGYTFYNFEPVFIYLPYKGEDGQPTFDITIKPKHSLFVPQAGYSIVKLWKDSEDNTNRPQQIEVEIFKDGILWDTQILNSDNGWYYSWTADADNAQWTVAEKNVPQGYNVTVTYNDGMFSIVNSLVPDQPSDPEDPDNPNDPEDPDDPNDPEDPDKPGAPEDPDKPSDPEDPDKPSDPEDPDKPSDPEKPDKPSDPEKPDKPSKPKPSKTPKPDIDVPDKSDSSNLYLYALLMSVSGLMLLILGIYRNRRDNEET